MPADERAWSPRLKVYFRALHQYHARRRETRLGTIIVTNLSGFPSSLAVIFVPNGDVRRHRESFVVNENLKRLGCSGRVGMTLTTPTDATQSKFYQLYHTSDKIPLQSSVIELVKLCQVALVLFGKLEPEYADGLLCDITEKALNDWWIDIGTEHYNFEPRDGILGPSTVAALLGLIMGARNRLRVFGAPVSKDVFDVESTKRGIAYFQKSQHLQRSRKFDRQTLDRLHRLTAKAASGEGWTMPRAVKSTVAELSGKGGDMLATRDKAGIVEIETVNIELFAQLVLGDKAKWLWHGKPRKSLPGDTLAQFSGDDKPIFPKDENSRHNRIGRRIDAKREDSSHRKKDHTAASRYEDFPSDEERESMSKRTVLKKATGRMTDAPRSGIGRFRNAVGRKGPQLRQAEDGLNSPTHDSRPYNRSPLAGDATYDHLNERDKAIEAELMKYDDYPVLQPQRLRPNKRREGSRSPVIKDTALSQDIRPAFTADEQTDFDDLPTPPIHGDSQDQTLQNGHVASTDNLNEQVKPDVKEVGSNIGLIRTLSLDAFESIYRPRKSQDRWPRRLSFSAAEESILTWAPVTCIARDSQMASKLSPKKQHYTETLFFTEIQQMQERVLRTNYHIGAWVDQQIAQVQELDTDAEKKQQIISEMYHPSLEEFHSLRERAEDTLSREKAELQDAVRSVEVLGAKLEYEINSLGSKVKDVEDTVFEFERQVLYVETRMQELENESRKREGWLAWLLRMISGIGQAPR